MLTSTSRVVVGLILSGGLFCSAVSCSSGNPSQEQHAAQSPSALPTRVHVDACPHATATPSPHRAVHLLLANGNAVPGSAYRVVVRPGTRIVATARLRNVTFRDPSATNKTVLARLSLQRHRNHPVSVSGTFLAVKPGRSRIIAKEPPARGIQLFAVSAFVRVRCANATAAHRSNAQPRDRVE